MTARRIVLVIAEVIGDLAFQGRLRQPLGQLQALGLGQLTSSSIRWSSTAFADTAGADSTASCSATFSLVIDASFMIGSQPNDSQFPCSCWPRSDPRPWSTPARWRCRQLPHRPHQTTPGGACVLLSHPLDPGQDSALSYSDRACRSLSQAGASSPPGKFPSLSGQTSWSASNDSSP